MDKYAAEAPTPQPSERLHARMPMAYKSPARARQNASFMIGYSYRLWIALAIVIVAGGAAFAWREAHTNRLETEVLGLLPDEVPRHPDLVSLSIAEAKPVYAAHCASCHGADMKGDTRTGAPNLSDGIWLYGSGNVTDIERTILYGIRSGHGQAHNVTEMPALGLSGMLAPGEINDVVQYVLSLSKRPNAAQAAISGSQIYAGKGMCGDCHGPDGRGDPYYGAPNLTANVFNNGGDTASLYRVIYSGLQRVCPSWYGIIPLEKIRALAVYLHAVSHSETGDYAS
jgi:cytochrome c oxidase cbb3-type subunit 3